MESFWIEQGNVKNKDLAKSDRKENAVELRQLLYKNLVIKTRW